MMPEKISMRLIRWTAGGGAVQINTVCPACHCSMQSTDLYSVARWWEQHRCPEILPIGELIVDGNVDVETLKEALKL
jgi:hypothetical protein